jgi:hypothetical protein
MSESFEGVSVAATRQNIGRSLYGTTVMSPGGRLPEKDAGGANVPAGTGCAREIFMPGDTSDARLTQDGPASSGTPKTAIASRTAQEHVDIFISLPFISAEEKGHGVYILGTSHALDQAWK